MPNWISVNDGLPPSHTEVFIFPRPEEGYNTVYTGSYTGFGSFWKYWANDGDGCVQIKWLVTHWMYITEPNKGGYKDV